MLDIFGVHKKNLINRVILKIEICRHLNESFFVQDIKKRYAKRKINNANF